MKAGLFPCLLSLFLLGATTRAEETFDEAMARASLDYAQRLHTASGELTQTRERIAREKAPLLNAMRAAEDRIIAADMEATRIETARDQSQENNRKIVKDANRSARTRATSAPWRMTD